MGLVRADASNESSRDPFRAAKRAALVLTLVVFGFILAVVGSTTVFEIQLNGVPTEGIRCEGVLPDFSLTTDVNGQIKLDGDLLDEEKTIMFSLYKGTNGLLNTSMRFKPGEYVALDILPNGKKITRTKGWGFLKSSSTVVQSNLPLKAVPSE